MEAGSETDFIFEPKNAPAGISPAEGVPVTTASERSSTSMSVRAESEETLSGLNSPVTLKVTAVAVAARQPSNAVNINLMPPICQLITIILVTPDGPEPEAGEVSM